MHSAAVHLLRRGLEVHQKSDYELPTWGIALLAATTVLFLMMNASIEYTFGRLIPTLVMVESPQSAVAEASKPLLDEKKPLDIVKQANATDAEVLAIPQPYITRTLCSTIRHLRAQTGCLGRFRGFVAFLVYTFSYCTTAHVLSMLPVPLPHGVPAILAALLCANLATTWTHIAISAPNARPWYQRVPGCAAWKKVAFPTLFFALAKHATIMVPVHIAGYWNMTDLSTDQMRSFKREEQHALLGKALFLVVVTLILAILFVLPTKVTLTRVQASLLGETERTIVPFDRSFGGRVFPAAIGGSGSASARDAWQSFGEEPKMNLLKTYGKVMFMGLTLTMGFVAAICAELVLIMGEDIRKFIPASGQVVMDGQ